MTSDHLGSPRINTDASGAVTARHDYQPFGEEIARASYGDDEVRKQFTGYEKDEETALDFAQARYFNSGVGRFSSPDDFSNATDSSNPQSWNLYAYVTNNPLILIDPTGMVPTDFVDDQTGTVTHIEDGKDQVIAAPTKVIENLQFVASQVRVIYSNLLNTLENNDNNNLHLTRSEFTSRVATTYGESSAFRMRASDELGNEMKAIAYVNQRNSVAYGSDNEQAKDYLNTSFANETVKMKLGNLAVVNERTGGPDLSNGATNWDGGEQALIPDSEKRTSVPAKEYGGKKGTWEVHKNTIGWEIQDSHYAKWKGNVGQGFRAPQVSTSLKGKIGFASTAVYGNTIFWKKK